MTKDEKTCACALGRVFGYQPRIAIGLMSNMGSAAAVFELSQKDRDDLLGPFNKYSGALTDALLDSTARELEGLEARGCGFLPYSDPAFPKLLKDCEDPPAGIYYKSSSSPEEIFGDRPAIGIVGTRDMSAYGKEWCIRLVEAMSQSPGKPSVVSGLAYGVDITAHLAALSCGLPTIAVLPCGIDSVYPAAHRTAAGRIVASRGGALITDYPPGTGPAAFTFLRRNRIIAALCRATVLIESKAHGGGLITARLADGYGREVFALPGRVDDSRSQGCNALIKEKIAEPIGNLSEACEALGLGRYCLKKAVDLGAKLAALYRGRPREQQEALMAVATEVRRHREISLEMLCKALDRPYSIVAGLVGILQSDGIICTDLLGRCSIVTKNV